MQWSNCCLLPDRFCQNSTLLIIILFTGFAPVFRNLVEIFIIMVLILVSSATLQAAGCLLACNNYLNLTVFTILKTLLIVFAVIFSCQHQSHFCALRKKLCRVHTNVYSVHCSFKFKVLLFQFNKRFDMYSLFRNKSSHDYNGNGTWLPGSQYLFLSKI